MKKRFLSFLASSLCAVVCLGILPSCGGDEAEEKFFLTFRMSDPGRTYEVRVDSISCSSTIIESFSEGENNSDSEMEITGTAVEFGIPDLKEKIEESGFMKLPQDKQTETQPSDGLTRTLHVILNGKERSVTVSGDDAPEPFLRAEAAVKEFLKETGH